MLVYLFVASDRLNEKQEKKLKWNLSNLQAALQVYVDENAAGNVTLINDCDSDDCEDWRLGISQPVKKKAQIKAPVTLFNDLAKQYGIDCEVGSIENGEYAPVSYFGSLEGQGDAFLSGEYLGL
ncbi:MAG: hypothetical protein ACFE0K_06730 [Alcanivorax sp.]|uniref:hypothetical protein n=1 Tax=Alcanivorax sp. TaxID=1872427 RepID=UPI003DA77F24